MSPLLDRIWFFQTLILPVQGALFSVSGDTFPGRVGGFRLSHNADEIPASALRALHQCILLELAHVIFAACDSSDVIVDPGEPFTYVIWPRELIR